MAATCIGRIPSLLRRARIPSLRRDGVPRILCDKIMQHDGAAWLRVWHQGAEDPCDLRVAVGMAVGASSACISDTSI